ncbi:hypothetical protein HanRHA438_Chr08g0334841 [Helianthus annuus]|nr:hypothetical protein HanRHA438_Chr08g0334841 [Helianthus annuus]
MVMSPNNWLSHATPGCISKTRHGWNRRTMWSRVLSRRSISRSLSLYLLPLCNEDTSPVTPALIISGCDKYPIFKCKQ